MHPKRIKLKPGLTGPAQIESVSLSPDNNRQDEDRKLSLDLGHDFAAGVRADARIIGKTMVELGRRAIGLHPRLIPRRRGQYPTAKINRRPD